jgi:Asp-tRNA(Asn)/Glu-tRNA(Gln) amidotransferase C subunit
MTRMSREDVAALARMVSLDVTDEDLVDITYRMDLILGDLEAFSDPQLDEVDPSPFLPFEEENDG